MIHSCHCLKYNRLIRIAIGKMDPDLRHTVLIFSIGIQSDPILKAGFNPAVSKEKNLQFLHQRFFLVSLVPVIGVRSS